MLEFIGFIALLAIGLYLLVVSFSIFLGESMFMGKVTMLTPIFFTISAAFLYFAFYLAPFTITWGTK